MLIRDDVDAAISRALAPFGLAPATDALMDTLDGFVEWDDEREDEDDE